MIYYSHWRKWNVWLTAKLLKGSDAKLEGLNWTQSHHSDASKFSNCQPVACFRFWFLFRIVQPELLRDQIFLMFCFFFTEREDSWTVTAFGLEKGQSGKKSRARTFTERLRFISTLDVMPRKFRSFKIFKNDGGH